MKLEIDMFRCTHNLASSLFIFGSGTFPPIIFFIILVDLALTNKIER